MINRVVMKQSERKLVQVKTLEGGTLVRFYAPYAPTMLFVVNPIIGAVSLENGNYIGPDTEVEVLTPREVITITAGGL